MLNRKKGGMMCGISALFSFQGEFDASAIVEMNTTIRHRGPDDEGYVFFSLSQEPPKVYGGVDTPETVLEGSLSYCPKHRLQRGDSCFAAAVLGHRRLAILDLSYRGHQPMSNASGNLWLTYNGEIYNFEEVKRELEALGYAFQTMTDTEVILAAYEAWGEACLKRFNGMFAFVIYDSQRKKVFAARDRFGVKPLYYWRSPSGFVAFASEIKQFTVLPGWEASVNPQRAYDFLQWGVFDHTEETLFADVFQLRGGECLTSNVGHGKIFRPMKQRWYELTASPFEGTFKEASLQFLDLFEDAVKLRLRADVDVGSCLSGGLDSSSIVCLVNRLLRDKGCHEKQKTFSACSDVVRFNEKLFMDQVVAQTDVSAHYTYPVLDRLFDVGAQMVWHQDEPFGSTSIYAQWLVFQLSKEQGVKVMLDGQGADEQLGGYHGFFGHRFYELFQSLRWQTLYREMRDSGRMHPHLNAWQSLGRRLLPSGLKQSIKKRMSPLWVDFRCLKANNLYPFLGQKENTVQDQSRQQLLFSSLPMLLHYEDRDSMAHSVESRTPFLDYRLVEFNLGLPSEMKMVSGWTKHVMREGMRGILPEAIRLRIDKIGFATAEEEWMKQEPMRFRTLLERAVEVSQGTIHANALSLFDQMVQGRIAFDFTPWRMMSFGQWLERFQVKM